MKANILIVDDSIVIKRILKKIVMEDGHNVIALGSDGQEGVDLYKEHKPDLVLLDITMPNRSGKECLEDIITENPGAKVIMFSSVSDDETLNECLNLGAKAYIKKAANLMGPEKTKEIVDAINNVIAS